MGSGPHRVGCPAARPCGGRSLLRHLQYDGTGTGGGDLEDSPDSAILLRRSWWSRLPGVAPWLLLSVALLACSAPPYETLSHETDLTGAYALGFQAACDIDCGSGRTVHVVVSPEDPGIIAAVVESTPANVTTAISPIAVREGLSDDEAVTVFTVETAVLSDEVAIVRIGRSEVTTEISTYVGRDYLVSLGDDGRWTLRTSEDTGITTTTAIS